MTTAIYEDAVRMLLCNAPPAAMPAPVVPIVLDLDMPWKPAVLVVGAALPTFEAVALAERGCAVETAHSFAGGLQRMHVAQWNIVVVAPSVQTEGDGVRFVRSFKNATLQSLPPSIADLIPRYKTIPFVIMPVGGSTEYAVFRTSTQWELADSSITPLSRPILKGRS